MSHGNRREISWKFVWLDLQTPCEAAPHLAHSIVAFSVSSNVFCNIVCHTQANAMDTAPSTSKGGRPSDAVWEHFTRDGHSKTGTHYVARCRYCDVAYQRGKVQNLRMHIAFACSSAPQTAKDDVLASLDESNNDCELQCSEEIQGSKNNAKKQKTSQQEIGKYFSGSNSIGKETKRLITDTLLKTYATNVRKYHSTMTVTHKSSTLQHYNVKDTN